LIDAAENSRREEGCNLVLQIFNRCAKQVVQSDPKARRLTSTSTANQNWRRIGLIDAADHYALGEYVVVIIVPLAGGPAGGCAFAGKVRS
jgi:hypothetical protein